MSREASLWAWLKAGGEKLEFLDMTRVEDMLSEGRPDVEGCHDGACFWTELKCCPRPAKESTHIRPRYRPGQLPWLKRRWEAGASCSVLLQVGERHAAQRYLLRAPAAVALSQGCTEATLRGAASIDPGAPAQDMVYLLGRLHGRYAEGAR